MLCRTQHFFKPHPLCRSCTPRVLCSLKLFFQPPWLRPRERGTQPRPAPMRCYHHSMSIMHLGNLTAPQPQRLCNPSQVLLVVAVLRFVHTGLQTAPLVLIRTETGLPRCSGGCTHVASPKARQLVFYCFPPLALLARCANPFCFGGRGVFSDALKRNRKY